MIIGGVLVNSNQKVNQFVSQSKNKVISEAEKLISKMKQQSSSMSMGSNQNQNSQKNMQQNSNQNNQNNQVENDF
jgi:hypothetical protein